MAETKLSLEEKLVEIRKGAAYVQKTKAGFGYKFAPEEEILAPLQHILEILNKDEEKEDLDYGTDII